MTKPTDYSAIPLPPLEADRRKFTFRQRRAEMLKIILTQGHTDLSVLKLSARYGVSPAQITHDKHVLVEYISESYFKPHKIKSSAVAAKQRALKGALEARDWKAVNAISDSLLGMGYDLGILDKSPEKVEVTEPIRITWGGEKPEIPKKKREGEKD